VLNQSNLDALIKASKRNGPRNVEDKSKSVQPCDFRLAGRLSNENARILSANQETLGSQLSDALLDYLGSELELKPNGLEQISVAEHMAAIPHLSYMVPISLTSTLCVAVLEFDLNIVFPIIERLLGGLGSPSSGVRELSEIEEEVMQDVALLIARSAEEAWHFPQSSLITDRPIQSSLLSKYCSPTEKVALLKFTVQIGDATGFFQLLLSASFSNLLINRNKGDQSQAKSRVAQFTMPSIRERILESDVALAANLFPLKVALRELIALQPGSVLKLRVPVSVPVMLSAEGKTIFEAAPVRNGSHKAAQLGRRVQRTIWEGE